MRAALARRAASIRNSSSRWFSAGGLVGWIMNTSRPRTFSSILTKISPSAKRRIVTAHSGCPKCSAISSASGRLAVPARSNSWLRESERSAMEALQNRRQTARSQGVTSWRGPAIDRAAGLGGGVALAPPPAAGRAPAGGEPAAPEIDVGAARPPDVDALKVGGARPDNELEQRLPAAGEAQPPAGGAVHAETGEGRRLLGDELGAGRIGERLKHPAHRVERRPGAHRP